jgi:AraC-like DNA-binding protein
MLIGSIDGVTPSPYSLTTAAPCALLWPAAMIVWGPGYVSDTHEHHSVQLVMAVEGRLRIRRDPAHPWVECGAALVKPDALHEVDASAAQVLLAFVDPESELGAALLDEVPEPITPVDDDRVASWRQQLGKAAALTSSRVEPWVRRSLLRHRRKPRLNPKLERVLGVIREDLSAHRRLTLKRMATIAGLSESRFMHVFTESIGVPPRPYILWLRVQRACGEMMRGATATQAAHRAGFSDGAHLSRTVRRMMGTTPIDLVHRRPASRTAFTAD